MNNYYLLLFLPAIVFFLLPIINLLYSDAKSKAEKKRMEEKRQAEAKAKAAAAAKCKEERQLAAELKKAEKANQPKRKPGRPRKNPPVQAVPKMQQIKADQPQEYAAKPFYSQPTPGELPTSCTPEQFAAWVQAQS